VVTKAGLKALIQRYVDKVNVYAAIEAAIRALIKNLPSPTTRSDRCVEHMLHNHLVDALQQPKELLSRFSSKQDWAVSTLPTRLWFRCPCKPCPDKTEKLRSFRKNRGLAWI
jgi:hypothetical protein